MRALPPARSLARVTQAAAVAAVTTGLIAGLTSCSPATSNAKATATATATGASSPCSYVVSGSPARPVDPPNPDDVVLTGQAEATIEMTAGTVTVTMDRARTPCTVHSFESLVAQQFYDNSTCHRLVDVGMFILQCGDPSGSSGGGPGYTYADELSGSETYPRGTVAMANRGKDTNGSQFFICWDDSPLPPKYTVFGTLDEKSLAVIGSIASQGVDGNDGVTPIADASITSVVMG